MYRFYHGSLTTKFEEGPSGYQKGGVDFNFAAYFFGNGDKWSLAINRTLYMGFRLGQK